MVVGDIRRKELTYININTLM